MFSPAAKKPVGGRAKDRTPAKDNAAVSAAAAAAPASPATPVSAVFAAETRSQTSSSAAAAAAFALDMPPRPATGTPAPWTARLSSTSRTHVLKETEKPSRPDNARPVLISDFPQPVQSAHVELFKSHGAGRGGISGGLDRNTGLCWLLCNNNLFVWSYSAGNAGKQCIILKMPQEICVAGSNEISLQHGHNWMLSFIRWDDWISGEMDGAARACNLAGILMCSQKSLAVVFWPNIFSVDNNPAIVSFVSDGQADDIDVHANERTNNDVKIASTGICSMLVSPIPGSSLYDCVAIICRSNSQIWRFECSPRSIKRQLVMHDLEMTSPIRSMTWCFPHVIFEEKRRGFFVLTDQGIHCWSLELKHSGTVSKVWYSKLVGSEEDAIIRNDQTGHNHVCLLDMQVDDNGQGVFVLFATFWKEASSKFSYSQYSILTLQCTLSDVSVMSAAENTLQKKNPAQVIIPKAQVDDENIPWSMRLRIGGKPAGSKMILSGDGMATIIYHLNKAMLFYPIDLTWRSGKVLDALAGPALDNDGGAWIVLTEKRGVWAVPEKAVFEMHPETLIEKDSDDEEAVALIGQHFQEFLNSGRIEETIEKLQKANAFERYGEFNAFARMSRSIVDTLAKQWTSTRAANVAVMVAISSQLLEKQRRHQKFLQFLAASKCHEELQKRQREALLAIMGHGEKLAAMIQLRELHNAFINSKAQNQFDAPDIEVESNRNRSALWALIQLVGEKACRDNIMLMERDKTEVFYSRVSDLEEFFNCLANHLGSLVGENLPLRLQTEQLFEIANACLSIIYSVYKYREIQNPWYPPMEGLLSWYFQQNVISAVWKVASLTLDFKAEADVSEHSVKAELVSLLQNVSDILLELYSTAISAKADREEDYQSIQMNYWKKRDVLLNALYMHVKELSATSEDASGSHSSFLIALAKRHAGYQILWNICHDRNDMEYLRQLMHESMGFKEGRFSNFVFEQCYMSHEYGKLLRLGEEFPDELSSFLQKHKDLLWLHEVFLNNFTSASENLHMISLSQRETMAVTEEEHEDSEGHGIELSLRERKHLLHLSKIAAFAGPPGYGEKVDQINADLRILSVQEEVCQHERGYSDSQILSRRQLVEICLNSPALVLRAFDVFAWSGNSFRIDNKSLLEMCWTRAADLDDWVTLRKSSDYEGWSDEQKLQTLSSTALYYASQKYYGPNSVCYEGSLEEVLPLFSDDTAKTSVETILMQHEDFSQAGELMVMALTLGKCGGGADFETQDSSLMAES